MMDGRNADATARSRSFTERPGATLGRYELLVPIASGGMAHVWAARLVGHGGFTKIVALKTMLPQLLEDPTFEAMFLNEARIAAKLRHPNVCETFDLGEDNGVLYLAMEWVDGPSLLRLLRPDGRTTQPIAHRLAAHIVAEACAGLHAAHELLDDDGTPLGVIHRDVSPHNILLSSAGAVKLTDFGVAKARGKSHATLNGALKGKVGYMSPEQLRGGAKLDRRSDIFGLGCVLYEITTGRRSFEGDNDAVVVHNILNAKVPRPRELDPAYPPDLESIVMTALGHQPEERFSTADEMGVALGAYLAKREAITAADVAQLVGSRYASDGDDRRERIRLACARSASNPEPSRRGASLEPGPLSSRPAISVAPVSSSGPASKKPFSFKPTSFTPQVRPTPSTTPQAFVPEPLPSSPLPIIPPAPPSSAPTSLLRGTPSTPQSFAPTSSGAISIKPSQVVTPAPPAPPRRILPAIVIGLATGLAVLGGGFFFLRRMPPPPPPAPPVVAAPEPTTPPAVASAPPAVATPAAAQKPLSPRVTFHVGPAKNVLILVDGVALPAGTTAVERPSTGSRRVVFRAERFEDYVEAVDASTPADVDVRLVPRGGNIRRPGSRPRPVAPTTSASGSALPNPYE